MRRPYRIHLVSEHASPLATMGGEDAGGQNVHVAALATALGAQGHHVTVLTRRDDRHLPDRVELAPGVVVEHVPAGPAAPIPKDELFAHMPQFAAGLAQRWSDDPPDVVHAHFWMSGWASVEAAGAVAGGAGAGSAGVAGAAAGGGVPVVQTFHALGAVKARHQGAADASPTERRAAEDRLVRAVDHIVATCADEAGELAALGADPDRVTVVPCGVDPAVFRPRGERLRLGAPAGGSPCRYRVVVVSRLVPRKGIDDVIRALPQLPEVELVVAGGPADRRALAADPEARRLRSIAAACGVERRVRLLGGLPRGMVPALLRSADVVVSAPWYEPFGIVPLEAMACGVPVVATAVGGMLDTVRPGRTGLLVGPHDPDGIAAAVGRLLANPSLRHRMGEEAVAVVRELYTWRQVARSTLDVYEQLVRSSDDWWAVPA
ncbi:MAG TPA: glycosyltransferase [Acidimicrobiales bacterium]